MRKFFYIALTLALSGLAIFFSSCLSGGSSVDRTDPIIPAPNIKEGAVDPLTNTITTTKEGVTVVMDHWSRTRVNRKYTNIDSRSPFYYLETWEQAFSSEVFHVTIKNETDKNVIIDFKETSMVDERKYVYRPMGIAEFRDKFVTKKMMDVKTNRGLEIAGQIMLNEIYANRRPVGPGKIAEGFLAFNLPSTQATTVSVNLTLEKEPEVATAAYERLQYRFNYIQDLVKRAQQPPIKRY